MSNSINNSGMSLTCPIPRAAYPANNLPVCVAGAGLSGHASLQSVIRYTTQQVFQPEVNEMREIAPHRYARLCYLTWERHERPSGDNRFGENHLYDSFTMLAQNIQSVARETFGSQINVLRAAHPDRFARLCELTWERHGRPSGDNRFGEHHLYDSFTMLAQNIQTVAREKFEQDINAMRREHPSRFARLCELTWEKHGRPVGDRHFGENHLYDSFTMLTQSIQIVAREKFEQEINAMRREHPSRFARLCELTWEKHGRPVGDRHFGEKHLYDSFTMLAENIQAVAREKFEQDINAMRREHPNRFARLCYLTWEKREGCGRPSGDKHFGENHLYDSFTMLAKNIQTVAREKFEQDINAMRRDHFSRFARLCYLTWERHGRPVRDRHFGENHLYDSFAMLAQNIQTVARETFEVQINTVRAAHPDRFARLCELTSESHGRPAGDRHFGENHLYDSFTMLVQSIQTVASETIQQALDKIASMNRLLSCCE